MGNEFATVDPAANRLSLTRQISATSSPRGTGYRDLVYRSWIGVRRISPGALAFVIPPGRHIARSFAGRSANAPAPLGVPEASPAQPSDRGRLSIPGPGGSHLLPSPARRRAPNEPVSPQIADERHRRPRPSFHAKKVERTQMLTACQPQIASLGPVIAHIRPSVVDIRQSGLTFLEPK